MKRSDPRHGTNAGYSQHRRDNEEPCQPCREEHALANRRRLYTANEVALTGGEWRPDNRGILRWVRDTTVLRREDMVDEEGKRIRHTLDKYAALWEAS